MVITQSTVQCTPYKEILERTLAGRIYCVMKRYSASLEALGLAVLAIFLFQ